MSTIRLDPDRVMATLPRQAISGVGEVWLKVERVARDGEPGERLFAQDLLDRIAESCTHRAAVDPSFKLLTPAPSMAGETTTHGLLKFWGYTVGNRGGFTASRRDVLDHVFAAERLPPVYHPAYLERWGGPESAKRLLFMAKALAAFIADRRRNDSHSAAIREWRADLEHLRTSYHGGRFDFPWPTPPR